MIKKKRRQLAIGAGLAFGALGTFVLTRFKRDRKDIVTRLESNSQIVETVNGRIEYTIIGTGVPVLISHGTLGGYDQGLGIAKLFLDEGFQLIVVSRAGYLRSSLETGQTPTQQADSYAQLLDKLGISQAGMIGVSGGGPSALQFVMRYPERCLGLVLMSAITIAPPPLPVIMKAIIRAQAVTLRFDFLWWLLFKLNLQGLMKMNGVDQALGYQVNQDAEKMAIIRELYQPLVTSSLRIAGVQNDDKQITNLQQYPTGEIAVPILVIHSPTDPLVSIDQARWIAEVAQNSSLIEIKDGGHICFVVRKEQIIPRINDFFNTNMSMFEVDLSQSDLSRR